MTGRMDLYEMDYDSIAKIKNEDIIFFEKFGDYSGAFLLVTEKEGIIRVYKDYFGSCSACDGIGMLRYDLYDKIYEDNISDKKYNKIVKEFFEKYTPFLTRDITELTKKDIKDAIFINKEWEVTDENAKRVVKLLVKKYNL